jgi:hypothetical protein
VFLRIRPPRTVRHHQEAPVPIRFSLALLVIVAAACGPSGPTLRTGSPALCTVELPSDVTGVLAYDDGLAVAHGALVQRMRGAGCALAPSGAPLAAEQLLDVDDHGALYVFPAEATSPGEVSTMLDGEYPQSMVARVTPNDEVSKLLPAGRGIWAFGVSPEGDALWSDACGPTGIFDVTSDGVSESTLDEPLTLWGLMPALLSDKHTFWSVGPRTCDPSAPLSDACGFALVRTTPEANTEAGATVVDFGSGFEQGVLQRCGAHVCTVFASAVVVRDDVGVVVSKLTRDNLAAADDEQITAATANAHGAYVTLHGARGMRVVFVPQ